MSPRPERFTTAIVPAGSGGAISVYATGSTDVIIDVNGYFAPPGAGGLSLYTVTPCRVADTRLAQGPLGGPSMVGSQIRKFPVASGACGVPVAFIDFTGSPGPPKH